ARNFQHRRSARPLQRCNDFIKRVLATGVIRTRSISAEDVNAIAMDQQQRPDRALAPMIMSAGLHPAGFALRHWPVDVLGYRQISRLLSPGIDNPALDAAQRSQLW